MLQSVTTLYFLSRCRCFLNNKLVKLFKLFDTETVNFSLGHDALSDEIIQTKIQIKNNNIELTAILNCDDSLMRAIPVEKIRGRAETIYPQIKAKPAIFEFSPIDGKVTIWDDNKHNSEELICTGFTGTDPYEVILDLKDLKLTLDTCTDQYVSMSFGDGQAVVLKRLNIYNIF